jgi:hypothetical protein
MGLLREISVVSETELQSGVTGSEWAEKNLQSFFKNLLTIPRPCGIINTEIKGCGQRKEGFDTMTKNTEITFEIVEEIAVLSTKGSWSMELNRVSWNHGPANYDIRKWNEDHTRMGKGVTLTEDEMNKLISTFNPDED